MATVDVTVMGAGIFGLSSAYACAQRGARVRVIDPHGIGAGSSGGIVGALAPHTPENWNDKKEFQFQSLLMAQKFWAEVDSLSGLSSGYGRLGRLQSIADERALELAQARVSGAADLWRGHAQWQVIEAGADWAPLSATGFLIHDTLSARLHPKQACDSLAAALRNMGVEIVIGEAPQEGQVLWATGVAGLEALSQGRSRVAGNGVKGQAILLRHAAGEVPQLYADALHIIPHHDGTVAIGSTSERDYASGTDTDAQLDEIHQRALRICPQLAGAPVIARWAGVRPRARSRAPMLGAWPDRTKERTGHFIANGGFKIGFGMAPKVAEAMAGLMLDNHDQIPEGFRIEASL